jgi:putative hydrolase of the HAD superfamily
MRADLPRAILFDLDDTILCFSPGAEGCWQAICARFAPRLGACDPEALLAAIHATREWFWSDPERHRRGRFDMEAARLEIVTSALLRLGIEAPGQAAEIARSYIQEREASIHPFPGAVETLRRLRECGVRLALITQGRGVDQRRKLTAHALEPLFDTILIEEEFGAGKPDPRVYLHALSQLEATPAQAWMVGDNLEWDVAAPQRLGIFAIWHDFAGAGLPPASPIIPGRIIRSLPELLWDGS